MRRSLVLLGLAYMLALAIPARAEDRVLNEAIGLAGPAIWLDSGAPGMVLVVVRGKETVIAGYGETAKGNNQQPDAHSLFRLGSITKVFATEVLAGMVADGKLRLTDRLAQYADGEQVPQYDSRPITLLDLATHSAGLPREMGYAPPGTPPFTWPTRQARWKWLAGYRLGWAPGTVAAYSNIGFDLLADAMQTASGQPYAALLREHVTGPLGMADTGFDPTPDQCHRLMLGTGIAPPGPCVDTHATEGSGGLYSTGADMARWLHHNLDTADFAAWPTLALAHASYRERQEMPLAIGFDEAGPMAALGLGWVVQNANGPRPMIFEKSGGGGGFMTYIAFAPGRGAGLFIAVSRVDFGMFFALAGAANQLLGNLVTR